MTSAIEGKKGVKTISILIQVQQTQMKLKTKYRNRKCHKKIFSNQFVCNENKNVR